MIAIFSIMIPTVNNQYFIVFNFVNQAVLLGDSTRPITCQSIFQRFWVTFSGKGVVRNIIYTFVDFL